MKYLIERYLEPIILDEFVKIRWAGKSVPYYKSLGYAYTKQNDEFMCRVDYLPSESNIRILVRCPICEETRFVKYRDIVRYKHTGCNRCSKIKDMTGEKYGRWTVIELDTGRKTIGETSYWMCRCECGTISSVIRNALTKGESLSCGCYQRDAIAGENNHNWKPLVTNICEECGNEYKIKPGEAENRKFCSIECVGKFNSRNNRGENNNFWNGGQIDTVCEMCGVVYKIHPGRKDTSRFCSRRCFFGWVSENKSGENSHNWNNDLSDEDRESRRLSTDNYQWVRDIYERDDYTCQICGERGGKLEAHHLYSYKHYPEKRLDLDNGITMCKKEHRAFHKWMGGNRNSCTPEDFERFKRERNST